jgi:hypothetical protein
VSGHHARENYKSIGNYGKNSKGIGNPLVKGGKNGSTY